MLEAVTKKRSKIKNSSLPFHRPLLPFSPPCTTRLISPGEQFSGLFLLFTMLKLQIPLTAVNVSGFSPNLTILSF